MQHESKVRSRCSYVEETLIWEGSVFWWMPSHRDHVSLEVILCKLSEEECQSWSGVDLILVCACCHVVVVVGLFVNRWIQNCVGGGTWCDWQSIVLFFKHSECSVSRVLNLQSDFMKKIRTVCWDGFVWSGARGVGIGLFGEEKLRKNGKF